MPRVIIKPDDIVFEVDSNKNILDHALTHNLNLPHGCKNGLCGACKCKVISGDIQLEAYNNSVLNEQEKHQGYTLLCKAHANSDIELYIPEILNNFKIKILPAKVVMIEKKNNVAIIKMKIPPAQSFDFFAGQYVEIILNGKNRSYSLANASGSGEIEFHVKYHQGGVFSKFVWQELALGQILRFRGPLGNFKLRQSNNPVIFVCTGTGFAPIKAILEEYAKTGNRLEQTQDQTRQNWNLNMKNYDREMYLYWGNRNAQDFYLLDQVFEWVKSLQLKIKLCLSREKHADFVSGYVTDQLKNDFTDLSDFEIYACGNLQMIEDVYELTTGQLKLKKSQFYSDAFTPSV